MSVTDLRDQYLRCIAEIDALDREMDKVERRLEELNDSRYEKLTRLRGLRASMESWRIPIPDTKPAKVLPRAGEVITDPQTRKAVCVLARSITEGDTIDPWNDCTDWQVDPPRPPTDDDPGELLPGFREIRLGPDVFYQAHVGGRWWPSLPGEEA